MNTSTTPSTSRRLMAMMMRQKEDISDDNTVPGAGVDDGDDRVDFEGKKPKKMTLNGAGSTSSGGGGGGGGRRVTGSGGGIGCQADKCVVDLTEAKRYHRRHKVCELHAKAASVVVSGLRQRFCQQCSRFHELSEFDETKRSCRRRLAGHNERRRKSSSEPQGEGGSSSSSSSSRPKGASATPQCRPADHERANRVQIPYPGNPAYKHFRSDKFGVVND